MITENEVIGELKRTQREFNVVRECVEKLLDSLPPTVPLNDAVVVAEGMRRFREGDE